MATIIAGRFEQQAQVQDAVGALLNAGFTEDKITSFYVNPPGQHDAYPIGGDREISPGAEETPKGAVTGGVVGAAIGVAATPIAGPAGPALGAYVGSLVGSLTETHEKDESPPVRPSGMLVGVSVPDGPHEAHAIYVLRQVEARDLERAEGTIENGDWVDFDPVTPPVLLDHKPGRKS
jgi:hypothetical protein